jgi:hypothetical protein
MNMYFTKLNLGSTINIIITNHISNHGKDCVFSCKLVTCTFLKTKKSKIEA